jgi:hypothetical protein
MRCATNGPKIGVQPVKSSRKPHKGNSSLVDVQGGPRGPTISQQKSLDLFFFVPAADGFFACDRRNDGRNKTQKICRICRISRLKLCISPNKNLENVSILRKNNRLCLQKGYRLVYFMAVKREK